MCNKPPCKPRPLLIKDKLIVSCNIQYINAIIAILLKRIDISRLKVTEIDSNKDSIDIISIERKVINYLGFLFFFRDRQGLYTEII